MTRIGIISDTHGFLRGEALKALDGADLILHVGDIGSPAVIDGLRALAPVRAVRGNCDVEGWADVYPWQRLVVIEKVPILVLHDRNALASASVEAGIRVVVSGHSHRPSVEEKDGILYVNPGSAGRRRFKLPVTVALLQVHGAEVAADIVDLFPL